MDLEAKIFGEFETSFFEDGVQSLSLFDVREVKQLLISRDVIKILQGVQKLENLLCDVDVVPKLIGVDIPQFLCDAMVPFDINVTRIIYSCFEKMARHRDFFIHGHSSFTIESIVRSLHFATAEGGRSDYLSQAVMLLALIIKGYAVFSTDMDKKSFENLLQLLSAVFKSGKLQPDTFLPVGLLIRGLLNIKVLKLKKIWTEILFKNIEIWLNQFGEVQKHSGVTDDHIGLGCAISASTLTLLVSDQIFEEEFLCSGFVSCVTSFLLNYAAPYVLELSCDEIETDVEKLESFFQALNHIYNDKMPPQSTISHQLSSKGFLYQITKMISFVNFENGQNLQKICLIVLSEIIISLSFDVFEFPLMWAEGKEKFRAEICKGMLQLPLDASQWLDVLSSQESHRSSKIALIVYLYFYCLTAKSSEMLATIYPAVAIFLCQNRPRSSSILLTKVVWFVYAISHLSSGASISQDDCSHLAMENLLKLIEEQTELHLIYTHHPAILYWTFCSPKICKDVQGKVVNLWLKNKTEDCNELQELMKTYWVVRSSVLDCLQNGSEDAAESAFSSLKNYMEESEDENLTSAIWFILPDELARRSTIESFHSKNMEFIVELATLKIPKEPNVTKLVRTAGLLPEMVTNTSMTLQILKLIQLTLEISTEMEDFRVINTYLRYQGFVQQIADTLNMEVTQMISISLKILSNLWKYGNDIDQTHTQCTVVIEVKSIFRHLDKQEGNILLSALEFVEEILKTDFESHVFKFDVPFTSSSIRILFYKIQNISVKNIPGTTAKCWSCLRLSMLQKSKDTETVVMHLSTNPWLHEVIRIGLLNLNDFLEMKNFLLLWIDRNCESHLNSERRICDSHFTRTVNSIAQTLIDNYCFEWNDLAQKIIEKRVPLSIKNRQELLYLYKMR